MVNCPYCQKEFKYWKNVRGHVPSCISNTGKYFIDLYYGPIHIDDFLGLNQKQLKNKFTQLKSPLRNIRKSFKCRNVNFSTMRVIYNNQELLDKIKKFVYDNNRIPTQLDFYYNPDYPSHRCIQKHFGSFNNAIREAGFKPNDYVSVIIEQGKLTIQKEENTSQS